MPPHNPFATWIDANRILGAVVFCAAVSVVPALLVWTTPGGGPAALATYGACWLAGTVVMVLVDSRRARTASETREAGDSERGSGNT